MPRYIDADAIRKTLQKLARDDLNQITCTTWAEAFEELAYMIDETQTIDAVEVVRCKDCIYSPYKKACNLPYGIDGYCPLGKRRKDE